MYATLDLLTTGEKYDNLVIAVRGKVKHLSGYRSITLFFEPFFEHTGSKEPR